MRLHRLAAAGIALALAPGAQAETFEMVTGPDYVPFTGRDLPGDGLAVEVLRAALESQGHTLELTFMPWKRGYELTAKGIVDGTFPYIRTEKRAQEVRFSEPMFTVAGEIVSAAAARVRFDGTKASLEGLTLCLPVGYATEPLIEEMIDSDRLNVLETRELNQCPAVIQNGRADFMVQNNFVWPAVIAQSAYERDDFHVAAESLKENDLHVIVGRQHADAAPILDAVNAGLAAIRDDGTFDALVDTHMARDE